LLKLPAFLLRFSPYLSHGRNSNQLVS